MSEPKIIDTWSVRTNEGSSQLYRLLDAGDAFEFEFTENGEWVKAEVIGPPPGVQLIAIHPSILSALAWRIEQLCAEKKSVN